MTFQVSFEKCLLRVSYVEKCGKLMEKWWNNCGKFHGFSNTFEVSWKQVGNFQVFSKYGQIIKNVTISEKNMVNTTYIAKKHGQRQPHTYISASQSGQPAIQPASRRPKIGRGAAGAGAGAASRH